MMVYSMGSQERQDRFKLLKSVGCSIAPQARISGRGYLGRWATWTTEIDGFGDPYRV
ncbi:MAG: hypothetical protein WCR08_10020 [Gammaproteobacteria bacterium]|jgi:hypothetical protein